MPRPLAHKWFRFWAPELMGEPDPDGFNLRELLAPHERWCYMALCAICALSPHQPAICKQPLMGFSDAELTTLMKVHPQVWREAKQKLIFCGKISVDASNVIIINNWDRHASKYFKGRGYKDPLLLPMTTEEAIALRAAEKVKHALFDKVVKHLNAKTGKAFRVSNKASYKHFSARFDEGFGWDDFKHVIDVKCQRWLGNEEMEPYLRPETLFSAGKFEGYRQERLIVRKQDVGEIGRVSILPEERKKYEARAKALYERKRAEIMFENGATTEEDWVNLMLKGMAFSFDEFFRAYLKKLRQTPGWSLEKDEEDDDELF